MKKFVALMALVAFTFAVQADCDKCPGEKKDCNKAKVEGKCSKDSTYSADAKCSKDSKCPTDAKCPKDGKCPATVEKKDDKK